MPPVLSLYQLMKSFGNMPVQYELFEYQSGVVIWQQRFMFPVNGVTQTFLVVFFILLSVFGRRAAPKIFERSIKVFRIAEPAGVGNLRIWHIGRQ